jgi:hypothetical protein
VARNQQVIAKALQCGLLRLCSKWNIRPAARAGSAAARGLCPGVAQGDRAEHSRQLEVLARSRHQVPVHYRQLLPDDLQDLADESS